MNLKFVMVALAILCSVCFCKPAIVVEDKVITYLNSLDQKGNNEVGQNATNGVEEKKAYIAVVEESSHKTYDELKAHFLRAYDVYERKDRILKVKKSNVVLDLSELEVNRESFARQVLQKIMPVGYVDKFKLVSVDTDRSFSKKQGVRIEGLRFNFCRLFNGRVVYGPKNFLSVRTNGNGELKDARMALQDLRETLEYVKINGNYHERIQSLDSVLIEEPDVVRTTNQEGFEQEEKIEKIEISSAAEAYCDVLVNGTRKLFPCLFYGSEIKLSNGDKFGYIISAPYSRQSWSDYKDEN